jgi:hypothetical protein
MVKALQIAVATVKARSSALRTAKLSESARVSGDWVPNLNIAVDV